MEYAYVGNDVLYDIIGSGNDEESMLFEYNNDGMRQIMEFGHKNHTNELIKTFYVYIYSLLDSWIDNIFTNRTSFSSFAFSSKAAWDHFRSYFSKFEKQQKKKKTVGMILT